MLREERRALKEHIRGNKRKHDIRLRIERCRLVVRRNDVDVGRRIYRTKR